MATLYGTKLVQTAPVTDANTVPDDGSFEELCKTYKDSVEISEDEPQIDEEFCDQSTDPIAVFTQPGKTTIKFQGFEFDTATLVKLLGGSDVSGEWVEGDNMGKEVALRLQTDSGHQITYPKGKLFAKKNMKLVKNKISLIDVIYKPMSKCRIKKLG